MDFKLRGDVDKGSSYFSSTGSSDGYFTEQALRAGYITGDMGKSDFLRDPMSVRAAIQREIEKERIRDEIIAAERRALEMEVRRELLLERELALQRRVHADGSGNVHPLSLMGSSMSMLRADQRLSLMPPPSESSCRVDESLAFPILAEVGMHIPEAVRPEERLSLPLELGASEKLSLRSSSEPGVVDIKPPAEVGKGSVLFFAKPTNSSLPSGMKRKALEPPPAIPSVKKKPQEWSCALCQVTATSEKGLADHLLGRKHKTREGAHLGSQTTNKNNGGSTSSTKKTVKLSKTAATADSPKLKQGDQGNKLGGNKMQPLNQEGDAPVLKKHKTDDLKNKTGDAPEQQKQKSEASNKMFKFWCQMCQVGTFSQKVMNSHYKGKKHLAQLVKKGNVRNIEVGTEKANGEIENVEGDDVDWIEEADEQEAGGTTKDETAIVMFKEPKET